MDISNSSATSRTGSTKSTPNDYNDLHYDNMSFFNHPSPISLSQPLSPKSRESCLRPLPKCSFVGKPGSIPPPATIFVLKFQQRLLPSECVSPLILVLIMNSMIIFSSPIISIKKLSYFWWGGCWPTPQTRSSLFPPAPHPLPFWVNFFSPPPAVSANPLPFSPFSSYFSSLFCSYSHSSLFIIPQIHYLNVKLLILFPYASVRPTHQVL